VKFSTAMTLTRVSQCQNFGARKKKAVGHFTRREIIVVIQFGSTTVPGSYINKFCRNGVSRWWLIAIISLTVCGKVIITLRKRASARNSLPTGFRKRIRKFPRLTKEAVLEYEPHVDRTCRGQSRFGDC
jgi:hypothetical protein